MAVGSGARASTTLKGDLRGRPLAVLLAGACERGTTGTFTFTHGERRDTLTLRNGQIAVVRESDRIAYLGAVVYELGLIDVTVLNETLLEIAKSKRLHGHVLLERGAITRDKLDEALAEQTFRKVNHLFTLPEETTWTFRENVDDLAGARDEDRPMIQTWHAIWRALRGRPAPAHVKRTLAKVDGNIHLRDIRLVERFGLAPEEYAICETLSREPTNFARLVATSPLPFGRTELLVYLLALGRCIVRIEAPPASPTKLGVDGIRERAKRIDSLAPHAVLGLRSGASAEAARAAYFRQARMWHPDKIPAELYAVRAECEHIFHRLGDAHREMTSNRPSARSNAAGGGNVPPSKRASKSSMKSRKSAASAADLAPAVGVSSPTMRDVDLALERVDLAAAEALARTLSCAGVVGPEARAVIAWCRVGAGAPADPSEIERAIAALDKVLTGDPDCVRALFYRGILSKRVGRSAAAKRDIRRVLRMDPAHEGAQREMRADDVGVAPTTKEAENADHSGIVLTRRTSSSARATTGPKSSGRRMTGRGSRG